MRLGDCGKTNLHTYSDKEKWSLIRYLDTGSITEGRIDEIQTLYPGVDKIPSRARRKASVGDILFSTVRPNQKHYGIIEAGTENLLVSTGFTVVTVDTTIADPYFIYYYLTQSSVIESLQAIAEQSTSTYPSIKPSDIEDIELDLPELETQKKIGSTLRMLDRKIALNEEINDNLEQQIQLIFDYLFPDVCAGNKHMGDFIIPKRGKSLLSKNAVHGNVPVIAGGLEPSIYHNVANTIAPVVTISSSGANAGFVNIWGVPVWSSDSSYIDSEMSRYVYFWYAYLKRHQNNIYNIQTGSAQPHIYPSHISSLPITDLDYKKIENYTEIVSPIFSTITKNHVENQHLQSLRDWLLPMLMNGQATIND